MTFRIPAAFLIISALTFSACCGSRTGTGGEKKTESEKQQVQNNQSADTLHKKTSGTSPSGPTAIKENSSVITGQIVDKKTLGGNDFELTVMVNASDDSTNYESLIVKGMVYQMKPAFIEENGEIKPVERNKKLLELINLPKGSTFRARVSLTGGNRCTIQEVLDK